MKNTKIAGLLLLVVLFFIGVLLLKNYRLVPATQSAPSPTTSLIKVTAVGKPAAAPTSPKYKPVALNKGDVLVSFRIDDINFSTDQRPLIEKAIELARKYHITFDLAVIAQAFDLHQDPAVFKLYQDNQDVLEVVSHGFDHVHYLNDADNGEFGGADVDYQEDHFKRMIAIFNKYHLTMATKILFTPWHGGDQNTINLAKKYNYKFLTQMYTTGGIVYYGQDITISSSIATDDISRLNHFIGQKQVEVVSHPEDFNTISHLETFIQQLKKLPSAKRQKYGFVSQALPGANNYL